MKNLLLFCLALLSSNAFAQRNIYQAYTDLAKTNDFFQEYKISKKGDKYTTLGITEEPLDVDLDTKNGYLQIQDNGTGGGTITITAVLYRKADGGEIIIAQRSVFDGVTSELRQVYCESNGKGWKTLQHQDLFPDFGYHTFFAAKPKVPNAQNHFLLNYKLPRQGTTITATLDYSLLSAICGQNEETEDPALCDLRQTEKYKTIELKWNKSQKQFTIASKK